MFRRALGFQARLLEPASGLSKDTAIISRQHKRRVSWAPKRPAQSSFPKRVGAIAMKAGMVSHFPGILEQNTLVVFNRYQLGMNQGLDML